MLANIFRNCCIDLVADEYFCIPGVPEFDIIPFDPFFIHEVETSRKNPLFTLNLKLVNVTESGWTNSHVKKFT